MIDYPLVDDPRVALSDLPPLGPWAQHARCRNAPQSVFFVGRGDDTTQAKRICARCPVIDDCLAYAVAAGRDLQGVWGGTGPKERARLRRTALVDTAGSDDQADTQHSSSAADLELYNILEQLAEYPGQWARVAHYSSRGSAWATASLLRTGRRRVPHGRWEFEGRPNPAGGSDVYARCLAEEISA